MNHELRMARIYIEQACVFRKRPSRRDNDWIAFLQNCTAKHRIEYLQELRGSRSSKDLEVGQLGFNF